MSETTNKALLEEVSKLRETGEALIERVEDVAASIRYMTNNLLDEAYHPEVAGSVRQLSKQVEELVSLSSSAASHEALPPFTQHLSEVARQCDDSAIAAPDASASTVLDEQEPSDAKPELPKYVEQRLKDLLVMLNDDAKQLAGCERLGEVTAWQWWENRWGAVRGALVELDRLHGLAADNSVDLTPFVEQQGGVPASLLTDQWPTDLVEAYVESEGASRSDADTNDSEKGDEGGGHGRNGAQQQTLFGAAAGAVGADATNEPADAPLSESTSAEPRPSQEEERDSLGNDRVEQQHRPYTIDDYWSFCERCEQDDITVEEWKVEYHGLRDEQRSFTEHLLRNHNAQGLKDLALRSGCMHAKSQTKPQNAETIYLACLKSFVLGNSIQYNPMSEKIEEAIDRIVEGLTEEDFSKHREKRRKQKEDHQKAIDNPETLLEFNTFVRVKGEESFRDEQHLRRDQLYADLSRQTRIERQSNSVQQFQSEDLDRLEFSIKEGFHEKRQCPLWIVQLSTRVERTTYGELKRKASQLGGWYSSFKKTDSGFQFLSQESAEKFAGLKEGDADRSEELEDRKIRKLTNTAERFKAMADRLTEQAETTLAADGDKLKNTHRRAEMAASTRARAREDLATAVTLQFLAAGLQDGQATYLDGIRYAVQVKTLRSRLRRASAAHIKQAIENDHGELSPYSKRLKQEELEGRRPDLSDIRYAEYPKPYLYRGHLEQALAKLASTKGVKQVTAKMKKLVTRVPEGQEFVEFYHEHEIDLLEDFLARAKAAGYDCYWFDHCLEDYKRLHAANICDAHELRAALAELVPHLTPAGQDDPVTQAMDSLRGKDLPGFFPTPKPLIYRMLELAEIQGTDRVLEPSAGMGNILDCLRQQHPDIELHAIEQNRTLADVLAAKGYDEIVEWGDFLEHQGEYDVCLMNPPFEKGQDIEHVRHAYNLLSPDGRLVAIMSEGPFFRSDAQSTEFREWLCSLDGAHDEELPANTFTGSEAFRQTGVRTRLITIDKSV